MVLGLIVVQLLVATFLAITMMGWWSPGRTLLTVFPLMVVPPASLAAGADPPVRAAKKGQRPKRAETGYRLKPWYSSPIRTATGRLVALASSKAVEMRSPSTSCSTR